MIHSTPRLSPLLQERLLEAGTTELFLDHYKRICERSEALTKNKAYAECVKETMEIASRARPHPYVVLGGMGVLCYAYAENPENVITWRGTADIDILGHHRTLDKVVKQVGFKPVLGNTWGRNAAGTSKIWTYDKNETGHVLAQVRQDVIIAGRDKTQQVYDSSIELPLYGINVKVPGPETFIAMKRDAGRSKDKVDIELLRQARAALQR
ncbi:MAG TPA: hypothetical protein VJH22_01290 [Candidatus Nanoarchaeia archaeon]|nr:hypothetical protein [Candidatus Nanoarchaeia archaeon]